MAKRIVTTLIALVLVFTALLPVGALSVVPMNDTPHEYSVLPGTDAWIEMSPEERRTATYVDQAEAENMTTRALLITTLGYFNRYVLYRVFSGLLSSGEHSLGAFKRN